MKKRIKGSRLSDADKREIEVLRRKGYSYEDIGKTFTARKASSGMRYRKTQREMYDAEYAEHMHYVACGKTKGRQENCTPF